MFVPATGGAHLSFGNYTWRDSSCVDAVDPVTAVLYGEATAARALNHISYHTGWGAPGGSITESVQYFETHFYCDRMDGERASATVVQTRFHVRLRQARDTDVNYGISSVASPHFEDIVTCGWEPAHAVRESVNGWSGYDEGRRKLYNTLSPSHYSYTTYRGNSILFRQCDGGFAGSNGDVRWFYTTPPDH